MLLFRSEEAIEQWARDSGERAGEWLTLAQTWALSQRWYVNRLDPGFRGRTPQEAEAIFASLGLTSDFWRF